MKIDRYYVGIDFDDRLVEKKYEEGEYVLYEDVEKLIKENEELKNKIKELKEEIQELVAARLKEK